MPANAFDYATVRVVPRVEREEFINVGVVLHCPTAAFLGCRLQLRRDRLAALSPHADADAIARHLAAFGDVCHGVVDAGPVAALPLRERFHWLVAPRSAMLQVSAVHSGTCDDLEAELARLFAFHVA